jgi:hypothetical protein
MLIKVIASHLGRYTQCQKEEEKKCILQAFFKRQEGRIKWKENYFDH